MTEEIKRWIGYQYEPLDIDSYHELESYLGAKMEEVDDPDVLRLKEVFTTMDINRALGWVDLYQKSFEDDTYIIDTADSEKVKLYGEVSPRLIFNKRSINNIRHLNTLFNVTNEVLAPGGYFWCHGRTAVLKKKIILSKYIFPFNHIIHAAHYFWHRMCPKLPFFRSIYYGITKGKNRTYNRVEILGRLARAGFDIVDEGFLHGEFFVLGRKARPPIWDDEPSCGPIIKLRRVGKDGNIIGVYKFRTMYSYSEYLQSYMYRHGGLAEGGKFKDDYRMNEWGKFLRRYWLDEIPMIINLFKGQLKLVGVRPLSRHYYSLYTPEMQDLRIKVKPGLIPPYYCDAETPKTLDDVQASERRYIEQYLEHPFKTDWKYFWGGLVNIIFKRKRSK